jgi:hypothetical protein
MRYQFHANKHQDRRKDHRSRQGWLAAPILAVLLVLVYPDRAMAYIDPATSSYFLQMLLAGLLAAALAVRIFWQNLKSFLARIFGRRPKPSPKSTTGAPDDTPGDRL